MAELQVTLRCSRVECPTLITVEWDETLPEGTAEIMVACPWHTRDGDRPEEHYYDAEGRWWDGRRFIACGDNESEAL